MTKITAKIGYDKHTTTKTHKGHSENEHVCDIQYIECDMDNIEFEVESCNYDCCCGDYDNNNNTKLINAINNAIDNADDDYESLDNIKKVLDKSIYGKIYSIIDSMDNPYPKIKNIRELIRNFSYDDNYDSISNSESNSENNTVTNDYPFATTFNKTDDKYITTMHFNESKNTDMLFVTSKYNDDCCCFTGMYNCAIPVQLTLIQPIKNENYFEKYDYVREYKWNNVDKYI